MNEDKWQKANPPTGAIGQSNRNKSRRQRAVRYRTDKKTGKIIFDPRDVQTSGVLSKTKDGEYVEVSFYHVSGMYGDRTLGRGLPPMKKSIARHHTKFRGTLRGSGTDSREYVKRLKAVVVRLEEKRRKSGLSSEETDRLKSTVVTLETYGVTRSDVSDILYKTLGRKEKK